MLLDQNDNSLIVFLAGAVGGGCSLNSSPKKNWVEKDGGLPNYICVIAKGIMKSGHSKSSAIAIAVSRIKVWAAGGDKVSADTKAKAATALAEWEALKAKAGAKKVVKASHPQTDELYLLLTEVGSFNTDRVRGAWNAREMAARQEYQKAQQANEPYVTSFGAAVESGYPYTYIKELWTDYILICIEDRDGEKLAKIPYTVDSDNDVEFGDPTPVEVKYVEVDPDLTAEEKELLGDLIRATNPIDRISELASRL